ncbi:MAG: putative transposase [Frankiales bacterium]|nr:putative transposase [Frankiales bacterium]
MEVLEAYDGTQCAWLAAKLAGVDAKTVARYVEVRDVGGDPFAPTRRPRLIDPVRQSAHIAFRPSWA